LDYTFNGKRKTLSLGVYPTVSLANSRIKANAARVELDNGVNPSDTRKAKKQAIKTNLENEQRLKDGLAIVGSFEYVAMEWLEKKVSNTSKSNQANVLGILKRVLLPYIGCELITNITPPQLLDTLRATEQNSSTMAHKALQIAGQVFRYGIAAGYCTSDITRDLKGALSHAKGKHFAAITEPQHLACY
jgi:hypothetical protein